MIADLKDRLEHVFNEDKLNTLCKLTNRPVGHLRFTATVGTDFTSVHCAIRSVGELAYDFARFSLQEFPWNGDVLVTGAVYVNEYCRGRGVGTLLNADRIEAATLAGASALVCTVRADNEVERKILFNNNWRMMDGFNSKYNQNHSVEFWIKKLA